MLSVVDGPIAVAQITDFLNEKVPLEKQDLEARSK